MPTRPAREERRDGCRRRGRFVQGPAVDANNPKPKAPCDALSDPDDGRWLRPGRSDEPCVGHKPARDLRILMMRLVKFRLPRAAWTISCASATRQAATRAVPAFAAALLGAMSLAVTPAHAASAIAQY